MILLTRNVDKEKTYQVKNVLNMVHQWLLGGEGRGKSGTAWNILISKGLSVLSKK